MLRQETQQTRKQNIRSYCALGACVCERKNMERLYLTRRCRHCTPSPRDTLSAACPLCTLWHDKPRNEFIKIVECSGCKCYSICYLFISTLILIFHHLGQNRNYHLYSSLCLISYYFYPILLNPQNSLIFPYQHFIIRETKEHLVLKIANTNHPHHPESFNSKYSVKLRSQ